MFNEPTILVIQGLPPNFVKADVMKLVMQAGRVYLKVLSLREKQATKSANVLIWNGSIVDKVKNHFDGFKIGEYQLSTSTLLYPGRTSRLIYELDATLDQKRHYNLGHQILNETKSHHVNFGNIDLKCKHKLSSRVLAMCVEEMAKIEAQAGRTMSDHQLTRAYRALHPLSQDSEVFVKIAGALCDTQVFTSADFFPKPSPAPELSNLNLFMGNTVFPRLEFIKWNLKNYLEQEKQKVRPQTEVTMAHNQVHQKVEMLQSEILAHVELMLKDKLTPDGSKQYHNYVKIYGEPDLPMCAKLKAFLEEYGPRKVYQHREMYNLVVALIPQKVNLHRLLEANGRIIDGKRLHISTAGLSLIKHIHGKDDVERRLQQQRIAEVMECDELMPGDEADMSELIAKAESQIKGGDGNGKGGAGEGVAECKVESQEGGPGVGVKDAAVKGCETQVKMEPKEEGTNSASEIKHVQAKGGRDDRRQHRRRVTAAMECGEVIVIPDDDEDENVPMKAAATKIKEEGKSETPEETSVGVINKIEVDESAKLLITNVKLEKMVECKVEPEWSAGVDAEDTETERGEIQVKMEPNEGAINIEKTGQLANIKTETMEVENAILGAETLEGVDDGETREGQMKLPKDEAAEGETCEGRVDAKTVEGEPTADEDGRAATDVDDSEDFKIIDEAFEDFSFDVICGNDENIQ